MILTITDPDRNINAAREALVAARYLKQVAQEHYDWSAVNSRSASADLARQRANVAAERAMLLRLDARRLLQDEEKVAGREFCANGTTSRGAKMLEGKRFTKWTEYTDVYSLYGSKDTWR